MIAHFYLMAESFAGNNKYTNEEIEEKIMRLSEDVQLINQFSDSNKLYTNYTDLYPQQFYSEYTVEQFICNIPQLKEEGVDRDILNTFQKIIQKSTETTLKSSEVIDVLLEFNDKNDCHGLIAFNKVDGIDDSFQIIYGIDGWYKFRRYFLSEHPKNPKFFIEECVKYFPNLKIHSRNEGSIEILFPDFIKKIIYHLTALNDYFRDSQDGLRHRQQVLTHFSGNCNLDEEASLEGNPGRKQHFTFEFMQDRGDDKGTLKPICCEPHLKLCTSDINGDNTYHQNRIYFHEGDANISNNKILIGHIGKHL